jgi:hypothetical protein
MLPETDHIGTETVAKGIARALEEYQLLVRVATFDEDGDDVSS